MIWFCIGWKDNQIKMVYGVSIKFEIVSVGC